jgi:peroxiredoxin
VDGTAGLLEHPPDVFARNVFWAGLEHGTDDAGKRFVIAGLPGFFRALRSLQGLPNYSIISLDENNVPACKHICTHDVICYTRC